MSDVFRQKYRELDEREKAALDQVKGKAGELHNLIEAYNMGPNGVHPDHRCLSLAKTKLEESVMWFVKGVTR